jgi:endonuclease YncB( thermonuclease family)
VLDTDRYGRAVSRCTVEGEDLGATMVERGMALAYVAYSDDYLPQQATAEAARAGLWQGEFQAHGTGTATRTSRSRTSRS